MILAASERGFSLCYVKTTEEAAKYVTLIKLFHIYLYLIFLIYPSNKLETKSSKKYFFIHDM